MASLSFMASLTRRFGLSQLFILTSFIALMMADFLFWKAEAFVVPQQTSDNVNFHNSNKNSLTLNSCWRHWIPESNGLRDVFWTPSNERDEASILFPTPFTSPLQNQSFSTESPLSLSLLQTSLMTACLALVLLTIPQPGAAVSGGGLDYAGTDISGQDFSISNAYKGKDFTQVIAKGTNFRNSNLQGCRFYKAYLVSKMIRSVCDMQLDCPFLRRLILH